MPNRNTIVNIKCRVSDSAKLPLSVTQGNVSERTNLAQKYSNQLQQGLEKISDGKKCSVSEYKQLISDIVGKDIHLNINPVKDSNVQGSIGRDFYFSSKSNSFGNFLIENTNADIAGYNMFLPLNKDKNIITNKYTALHEARHLFDYICHPKTITMRSCKLLYEDKKLESFHKIYNAFTKDYRPFLCHSHFKKEIKEELNKLSNEEAIDVLQASRQTIISEKNAYHDEINYLKRKPVSNASSLCSCFDFIGAMRYGRKYKFINQLLSEKIKLARDEIHQKNNKKG